jgi:adenylate cyclase
VDFAEAGLLDGLEGEARQARLELLGRLHDDGVSLDQLAAAVAEERLALVPVERALGGRYTADEIAAKTGVPAEFVRRIRRALGFPDAAADERAWSEDELRAAESVKLFLDAGISEESLLEITRVLGEGSARLGSTIAASFADTYLKPGDNERDVALRYGAMTRQLLPAMGPVLTAALGNHLHEAARRGIIGRRELDRGTVTSEEHAVVCFADLVGFTSLGGEIGAEELGGVARALAELAADVAKPPVRLIKTIGDAAMFVSPEATPMVETALSLVEAVEEADLPALRAGIASGPVLNRAGDWYGNAVNLASRVTGVARPGSVLCTAEVHDEAGEQFAWRSAGRFRLKGVSEPVVLYRARRPEDGATAKRSSGGRSRRRASR